MSKPNRLLLTGATGLLGRYLQTTLSEGYDVLAVSRRSEVSRHYRRADLTHQIAVDEMVRDAAPSIVVHAAALSDVDNCETDRLAAFRQNVLATKFLVDAIAKYTPNAHFVYVSSDQGYQGPGPSAEEAATPRCVYAITKMWGEDIVRYLPNALVVRVNFVATPLPDRLGFVGWAVNALRNQSPIRLFSDAMFNPLHGKMLANVIRELIELRTTGLLNVGASGNGVSKAEFILELAKRMGLDTACTSQTKLADFCFSAPRSNDTRMNVDRLSCVLGRRLPDMHDVVAAMAEDFQESRGYV